MKSQTRVLRNILLMFVLITALYLPAMADSDEKPQGKFYSTFSSLPFKIIPSRRF